MYTAFQKLGYTSYHFLEVSMHNIPERHLEYWHEALTNKLDGGKPIEPALLDKLLGKYSVFCVRVLLRRRLKDLVGNDRRTLRQLHR